METVKKENERILRAQEELNQILMEIFHTEGKDNRTEFEDMGYQHKIKRLNKLKMKLSHLLKYMVIHINKTSIILVIVVKIITILGREILNLTKKSLGNSRRSSHQPLMEKLKKGKKQNPSCPG